MEHDFDPSDWASRLVTTLEALASRVRPSVPYTEVDVSGRPQHYSRLVSYSQYRTLAKRAKHDPAIRTTFEQSDIWLDDDPTDAIAVLREHPVIDRVLTTPYDNMSIKFVSPFRSFNVELKILALSLVKLAVKTDAENAARTLHRFLVLGEARKLKAHQITLLYGLKVNDRLDIEDGAFLAPYKDVKATYGLDDDRGIGYPPSERHDGPSTDAGSETIVVLVREMTWGPAIISTAEELETTLSTEYRFAIEDNIVEEPSFTVDFPKDHETVRDFLSITVGKHLLARQQIIRVDRWMDDLNPNVASGWSSGGGWVNDWWPRERLLSDDNAKTFLEMIRGWRKYKGDRKLLGLAIRRLATSRSRAGGFGTEDQILDTAIALETMYDLDGSEITYKLETRAGYFLGKDSKERMEIFRKVKGFYDARSAIAHGSRGRGRRISLEGALADGYGIALGTLLKLLHDGKVPDWNSLVMSSGEGG